MTKPNTNPPRPAAHPARASQAFSPDAAGVVPSTPGWRFAVLLCLLLAGCGRSEEVSVVDKQIVCSLKGEAFYVQPGSGDISFVRRTQTADALCKGNP